MNDQKDPIDNKILVDAVQEIKEMGKEGMAHPSTKPVLIGAGAGAVAGAVAGTVLPIVSWPLGLAAGAAFMIYKRIRP